MNNENTDKTKRKTNTDEILENAYSLIGQHIIPQKSEIWMITSINKIVPVLKKKYWLKEEDIQNYVFLKFLALNKHEKFDPAKSCLYTYTARHTYFVVKDMLNGYERAFKDVVQFKSFGEYLWTSSSEDSDEPLIVAVDTGQHLPRSEDDLLDRLIERTTPEDILIKKEFWGLVYDYYDKVDVMVLLGMMNRKEAAAKFDMGHEAYTKSLQRKNVYFRDIATKAGYC